MVSESEQAKLEDFTRSVFADFNATEQDYILDEIARTTAANSDAATYTGERAALEFIFEADLEDEVKIHNLDVQKVELAAEDAESSGDLYGAVEEHFGMTKLQAQAGFIALALGIGLVANGEVNAEAVVTILMNTPTLAMALRQLYNESR